MIVPQLSREEIEANIRAEESRAKLGTGLFAILALMGLIFLIRRSF